MSSQPIEPLTDEQLAEWQRLCEQATPGEWEWGADGECFDACLIGAGGCLFIRIAGRPGLPSSNDAAFLAAARTALPAILAEVRRLRAGIEAEREACAGLAELMASGASDAGTDESRKAGRFARRIAAAIRARGGLTP